MRCADRTNAAHMHFVSVIDPSRRQNQHADVQRATGATGATGEKLQMWISYLCDQRWTNMQIFQYNSTQQHHTIQLQNQTNTNKPPPLNQEEFLKKKRNRRC